MSDERIYPCVKCGLLRSKAEGGTTFSVCDSCWDKLHPPEQPKPEPGAGLAVTATIAIQAARIAELEKALEAIAPYLPSLDEGPVRFSAHAIAAGMCRVALTSGKGAP